MDFPDIGELLAAWRQSIWFGPAATFAGGAVTSILAQLVLERVQKSLELRRNVFWRDFFRSDIDVKICMTEYALEEFAAPGSIARKVGARYFVSSGSYQALRWVLRALSVFSKQQKNISVIGDKNATERVRHTIILGSPINNQVAKGIFQALNRRKGLVLKFNEDTSNGKGLPGSVALEVYEGERVFCMHVDRELGSGIDYAILLRATMEGDPPNHVMMISGVGMYGTQMLAESLNDKEFQKAVKKRVGKSTNFALICEVNVVNFTPIDIRIIDKIDI